MHVVFKQELENLCKTAEDSIRQNTEMSADYVSMKAEHGAMKAERDQMSDEHFQIEHKYKIQSTKLQDCQAELDKLRAATLQTDKDETQVVISDILSLDDLLSTLSFIDRILKTYFIY